MIYVVLTQRARGIDGPMTGGIRWDVPIERPQPLTAQSLEATIRDASRLFLERYPCPNGAYCFGSYQENPHA